MVSVVAAVVVLVAIMVLVEILLGCGLVVAMGVIVDGSRSSESCLSEMTPCEGDGDEGDSPGLVPCLEARRGRHSESLMEEGYWVLAPGWRGQALLFVLGVLLG